MTTDFRVGGSAAARARGGGGSESRGACSDSAGAVGAIRQLFERKEAFWHYDGIRLRMPSAPAGSKRRLG